jgi:chitinase
MTGTLIITNPPSATPPTISITNPAANTVFAAPASVTIQAAATNGSGTVTNVLFLVNSRILANVAAAPYSAITNNLIAGAYTLTDIATDNNGLTATNSTAISVVTPVAISVSAAAFSPPNHFRFSYSANTGLTYVVQVSSNLLTWSSLVTNAATASPMTFTNPNASSRNAFYRVGRLPNP